jgi:hypothetical protein
MRVTLAALLAVLTACLITACGGDTLALDPVADAATRTEAAKSMRIELSLATAGVGVQPLTISAKGAVDGERSALTLSMPQSGGVDLGDVELRSDGSVVYMRVPYLQQLAPSLKPWIKLDLEGARGKGGLVDSLLEASRQADPTQALAYLRAAGDVEELGTATVRGVKTTHYRAVVDLERYAQQLDDGKNGLAAAIRRVVEETGVKTMPIELWVGDDSLVRRLSWKQATPLPTGQEAELALTMDLFDFGADVDVTLPSDDETTSFSEVLKLWGTG